MKQHALICAYNRSDRLERVMALPQSSGSRRERSLELAAGGHLENDVAAANQLAARIQLRVCGPVAEFFEARADGLVAQNVEGREGNLRRASQRNASASACKAAQREAHAHRWREWPPPPCG